MSSWRRSQGGNVTLITAFCMLLMLVMIMVATGGAEIAQGSTDMQAVSDQAALTAGAAQVGLLNDQTVVDLIQWTFDTVKTIGSDIEIAGAAAISIGAALAVFGGVSSALVAVGRVLREVGGRVKKIGDELQSKFSKISGAVDKYVKAAKTILSLANSSLLAANNGYLGVSLPARISLPGPSTLTAQAVDDFLTHARQIASQDNSFGSTRAEAFRYQALHSIWNDAVTGQNPITVTSKDGKTRQLVYPRAHPNTWVITSDPWPGCDVITQEKQEAGIVNGQPGATTITVAGENPLPPPCNDLGELYRAMAVPFRGEIQMIDTLAAELVQQTGFPDSSTSIGAKLADMNSVRNELLNEINQNNPKWIQQKVLGVYNAQNSADCPDTPFFTLKTVIAINQKKIKYQDDSKHGDAKYGKFTDCDGYATPSPPMAPPLNPNKCDPTPPLCYFWEGEMEGGTGDADHHHDFRQTADYASSEDARNLGDWVDANTLPTGQPGSNASPNDAVVFLMFHKVQPSTSTTLVAGLTGASPPTDQWAIAASVVSIVQGSPTSGDNVRFGRLCQAVFGGTGEQANYDGPLGLPGDASQWCNFLATALVTGPAQLFNALPSALQTLLQHLIAQPPNPAAYHAQLVDLCPVPGLSDIVPVMTAIDQAKKNGTTDTELFKLGYRAVLQLVQKYQGASRLLNDVKAVSADLPPVEDPPGKDCPTNLHFSVPHLHARNSKEPPGLKLDPPETRRQYYITAEPTGQWPAGKSCAIKVNQPSGSKASGLSPHSVDSKGNLGAWKWLVGNYKIIPATVNVEVSCDDSKKTTVSGSFTVTERPKPPRKSPTPSPPPVVVAKPPPGSVAIGQPCRKCRESLHIAVTVQANVPVGSRCDVTWTWAPGKTSVQKAINSSGGTLFVQQNPPAGTAAGPGSILVVCRVSGVARQSTQPVVWADA